jgi:uncharacterized protein (TIGR02646 family)
MKIDRGHAPDYLLSDEVALAIERLEAFYLSDNRGQKRYDFPSNYTIDNELRSYLRRRFQEKCCYCETRIAISELAIVERFRPHSGIRDKSDYFPDLYWWLTFRWDNLLYCCKECLQYKANYFPIAGKRAMFKADDLDAEDCLLFDPCNDHRELHFDYDEDGNIYPLTVKADQSISLLRLARPSLKDKRIETRHSLITSIDKLLGGRSNPIRDTHIAYLLAIYNEQPDIEVLSFQRWALLKELERWPSLAKTMGIEEKWIEERQQSVAANMVEMPAAGDKGITNDYFPIEYIQIKNFKGVSNLTINFRENEVDRKSWLFLLGENGVGKSSILQAIAIGIKADENSIKPLIPALIQKGKPRAEIKIKQRDSENIITTILTRKGASISQQGIFDSYLLGYGSLRLSVEETNYSERQDKARISYENLFNPIKPLNDITKWLKRIHKGNPKFFNAVAWSIKQLLPHDFLDNDLTIEKGEIMFRNSKKLFSELSDGFKSTIILAVDIMMKLSSAQADMDKMSGIVIIDELGNQLHPRWQMRIVKQLRTVFKNLNFIISTHHPLCLRGSENGEVLLLKNVDNQLVSVTDLPDPASLRVDQILASEFFGLNSLIDPELEAKFNRYYELLAKEKNINSKEQQELDSLKDKLRSQKQLGASLREELMYYAIDSLLASKLVYDKTPANRQQLKEEVVRRVGDIWRKLNISNHDQG